MIKNRDEKINQIVSTIKDNISQTNDVYRSGPDLYFYKRSMQLRKKSNNISDFLNNDYNLEILYATLVSWDMNSRAAKMKYFDDFKNNVLSCLNQFEQLEKYENDGNSNIEEIIHNLEIIYNSLNLMKTESQLVSNSKLLHFLFPNMLMPMDRRNTLNYLYGNTGESPNKYIEIIRLSYEIMNKHENFEKYIDDDWNTSVPKLIDNAIILLVGISIKNT